MTQEDNKFWKKYLLMAIIVTIVFVSFIVWFNSKYTYQCNVCNREVEAKGRMGYYCPSHGKIQHPILVEKDVFNASK